MTHDEDVRLVRMLTPDERVAMWKVARGLGRTKDEDVLLDALYHDHADCAAGRGLSPLVDALEAAWRAQDANYNATDAVLSGRINFEEREAYNYDAWVAHDHAERVMGEGALHDE